MEKFRTFYLASGVLFLLVSIAGGAWWELSIGEQSKPLLYLSLSPFSLELDFLGSKILKVPPFMEALFLVERGLATLGACTIIAGSSLKGKPWFRRLFNLRPLTTSIGFLVLIILVTALLPRYLNSFLPSLPQVAPNFAEALVPYASRHLSLNLYPLARVNGSLNLGLTSRFTTVFWIALLSGFLCLIGKVLLRIETRSVSVEVVSKEKLPPPPPESKQLVFKKALTKILS